MFVAQSKELSRGRQRSVIYYIICYTLIIDIDNRSSYLETLRTI